MHVLLPFFDWTNPGNSAISKSNILYENLDSDKFIYNERTGVKKISPEYGQKIRFFNDVKNITFKVADTSSGMLDVTKVISFIEQVHFKISMYKSVNIGLSPFA